MGTFISICEVGPRDGFQIEPEFIPTELKVEVIDRLSATGLPKIEVTSFVHPKAVPQLRDAEEVMAKITRRTGDRLRRPGAQRQGRHARHCRWCGPDPHRAVGQ